MSEKTDLELLHAYTARAAAAEEDRNEEALLSGNRYHHHGGYRHHRYKPAGAKAFSQGLSDDDEDAFDDLAMDDELLLRQRDNRAIDRVDRLATQFAGDEFADHAADDDHLDLVGGEFVEEEDDDDDIALEAAATEIPEVHIDWKTTPFHFRHETQLSKLTTKAGIRINFGTIFGRNKAIRKLMASGAYLGDIKLTNLRHNAHVSLAATVSTDATTNKDFVIPANEYLRSVDTPVHAVLSKRMTSGIDIPVRKDSLVTSTWLSNFPGWSVADLDKKIQPTLTKGVVEITTDHPVAQYLARGGTVDQEDLDNRDSIHADLLDVKQSRAAIEAEEVDNLKMKDAKHLTLNLVRAYGTRTVAGAPKWEDPEEIADDYSVDGRTPSVIASRLNAPVVIEGSWELTHGLPSEYQFEDDY